VGVTIDNCVGGHGSVGGLQGFIVGILSRGPPKIARASMEQGQPRFFTLEEVAIYLNVSVPATGLNPNGNPPSFRSPPLR
jgi:hypothetical protein